MLYRRAPRLGKRARAAPSGACTCALLPCARAQEQKCGVQLWLFASGRAVGSPTRQVEAPPGPPPSESPPVLVGSRLQARLPEAALWAPSASRGPAAEAASQGFSGGCTLAVPSGRERRAGSRGPFPQSHLEVACVRADGSPTRQVEAPPGPPPSDSPRGARAENMRACFVWL